MSLSQTPPPVSITQVNPQELHAVWPFVRGEKAQAAIRGIDGAIIVRSRPASGLEAVIVKAAPVDFIPEDIYAAIRFNHALLYMVTRGPRTLGFFVVYTQRRPFSNKLEYFNWCSYTIRLRERLLDDNVGEAVALSIDFMRNQGRALGCDRVVTMSRRPGYERFGFTKGFITWEMPV